MGLLARIKRIKARLFEAHNPTTSPNTDNLTGLPGKDALCAEVAKEIEAGRKCVLLYMDLDNFKYVNDNHGHHAGDELLKAAAKRMLRVVKGDDLVSRLHGDEFAILLRNSGVYAAEAVASRLIAALSEPYTFGEESVIATPSIGAVLCPEDGDTPENALHLADKSMQMAKSLGKARMVVYRPKQGDPTNDPMCRGAFGIPADPNIRAEARIVVDLYKPRLACDEVESLVWVDMEVVGGGKFGRLSHATLKSYIADRFYPLYIRLLKEKACDLAKRKEGHVFAIVADKSWINAPPRREEIIDTLINCGIPLGNIWWVIRYGDYLRQGRGSAPDSKKIPTNCVLFLDTWPELVIARPSEYGRKIRAVCLPKHAVKDCGPTVAAAAGAYKALRMPFFVQGCPLDRPELPITWSLTTR